jgi:hypothetical protein
MTTTEPVSQVPPPTNERRFVLRKIALVIWTLGFFALFTALRSHVHLSAFHRCLVGGGVLCVTAVPAFWFLGKEVQASLRIWRIFFAAWAQLVTPLILTIADGIASEGWPTGRFNRPIAHLLSLLLTLTIPAFLTGLVALIRSYRLAGVFAVATGVTYFARSIALIRAAVPIKVWPIRPVDVLDFVVLSAKVLAYISIPMGIALVVGGIMTLRAVRARTLAARTTSQTLPQDFAAS